MDSFFVQNLRAYSTPRTRERCAAHHRGSGIGAFPSSAATASASSPSSSHAMTPRRHRHTASPASSQTVISVSPLLRASPRRRRREDAAIPCAPRAPAPDDEVFLEGGLFSVGEGPAVRSSAAATTKGPAPLAYQPSPSVLSLERALDEELGEWAAQARRVAALAQVLEGGTGSVGGGAPLSSPQWPPPPPPKEAGRAVAARAVTMPDRPPPAGLATMPVRRPAAPSQPQKEPPPQPTAAAEAPASRLSPASSSSPLLLSSSSSSSSSLPTRLSASPQRKLSPSPPPSSQRERERIAAAVANSGSGSGSGSGSRGTGVVATTGRVVMGRGRGNGAGEHAALASALRDVREELREHECEVFRLRTLLEESERADDEEAGGQARGGRLLRDEVADACHKQQGARMREALEAELLRCRSREADLRTALATLEEEP